MALEDREFLHRSCYNYNQGDDVALIQRNASHVAPPAVVASQAFHDLKIHCSYRICVMLMVFASTYFNEISGQGVANFIVQSNDYDCSTNIICLGQAHPYNPDGERVSGIMNGRLALLYRGNLSEVGVAYYHKPVKFLDLTTQRAASFSTWFTIDARNDHTWPGDGMAFVISAGNSSGGSAGASLGIFGDAASNYSTKVKSIVVEFDTFQNSDFTVNDINANHVSFDFKNITTVATADATPAVILDDIDTKYAWVDYSAETRQLEVRLSYSSIRPNDPLLNYTVNLFNFVEEYMWVGFSSSSGSLDNSGSSGVINFYLGDWTFNSTFEPHLVPVVAPTAPASASSPTGAPTSELQSKGNKEGTTIAIAISVSIACFLIACILIVISALVWRRACRGTFVEEEAIKGLEMPKRFTYRELSAATKGFSDGSKLGQGAFGSVYRGVLPSSKIPVAVKKIKSDSDQGEKEFMAEVSIIGLLRHRNLIQLQGWCKDPSQGKYLLVYELMPNGSLDKVLFTKQTGESSAACLSWPQRFNIVTGTASALDYLHQGWKQQVLHRDVKSSNIILDKDWTAKLGDFGLARLVDHHMEANTTQLAGTLGYLAPEVFPRGKFTDKTDVFAFGAVLLEVACGRRALSSVVPDDEQVLVDWVWDKFTNNDLFSAVDNRLEEYDSSKMEVVLKVGLLCSHPDPSARPSMRGVVEMLAGDIPVPSIPASKPTPIYNSKPPLAELDAMLER